MANDIFPNLLVEVGLYGREELDLGLGVLRVNVGCSMSVRKRMVGSAGGSICGLILYGY